MSDGGKGSSPRPYSIDKKTFEDNWDKIFINKGNKMSEQKSTPCGCGRSPTGQCIGWHALSNEEYKVKLQEQQLTESKQLLKE
jgi:hypothetical protein